MTYGEIEEVLKDHGLNSMIEQLREAVGREAVELMVGFDNFTEETAIAQAREFYANDISRWLEEGGSLDATALLEKRARYSQSWAFAAIINGLHEKEIEEIAIPEVDPDTLTRICIANAELGSLVAELVGRLHTPGEEGLHVHPSYYILKELSDVLNHAKAPEVAASGRQLRHVERLEALLEDFANANSVIAVNQPSVPCDECPVHEADVIKTAKNLAWMAEKIHQGYHGDDDASTWRECKVGVCGSMEHMLAAVGLDLSFNPTERRI